MTLFFDELFGLVSRFRQSSSKSDLVKRIVTSLQHATAGLAGSSEPSHKVVIECLEDVETYPGSTIFTPYARLRHRMMTNLGYRVLLVKGREFAKGMSNRDRIRYLRRELSKSPEDHLRLSSNSVYVGENRSPKREAIK